MIKLNLQDVEILIVLMQQVKIGVGAYPFNDLNKVGETINKLSALYEHLKGEQDECKNQK